MICTNKYSYVEESSKETYDAKKQKERCMSMLEEALSLTLHVDFRRRDIHLKVYQN